MLLKDNDPLASRKRLYDELVADQKYSKGFDSFSAQFSTHTSRERLYQDLVEEQKYSKDFDSFTSQFFADIIPEKKSPSPTLADQLQVIPSREKVSSPDSGDGANKLSDIIPPVAPSDATRVATERKALPGELNYNYKTTQEMQGDIFAGIAASMRQSRQARSSSEIVLSQPKEVVIEHFENELQRMTERQKALQQQGKKDEPVPLLSGQGIGELIGSTAEDITAALIGSLVNPWLGLSVGVSMPAYKGYGQGFGSAYLQARQEGKGKNEAFEIASRVSKLDALFAGVEGLLGTVAGPAGRSAGKLTQSLGGGKLLQNIAKVLGESSSDAAAAAGLQSASNVARQQEGLQTEFTQGTAENAAAEFTFSTIMQLGQKLLGIKSNTNLSSEQKTAQTAQEASQTASELEMNIDQANEQLMQQSTPESQDQPSSTLTDQPPVAREIPQLLTESQDPQANPILAMESIKSEIEQQAREAGVTIAQNAINPIKPVVAIVNEGFKQINRFQYNVFGKQANQLEDWIAKQAVKGVTHKNGIVRSAAGIFKNLMGGLVYTEETARQKMGFKGGLAYADKQSQMFYDESVKIVDQDPDSMIRVHSLLDPEAYAKREDLQQDNLPQTIEDLNDSEKALYELLRKTNDEIHTWHHENGFIDEETYQKYKGKYIARLYEESDLDQLPEDIEKMMEKGNNSFSGQTKIDLDIFKARKEIDQVRSTLLQDPVYLTARRLSQMMKSKAIIDYADQVASNYKIYSSPRPGYTQLQANKPAYGALTNKYVPDFVAEDFKGFFFANETANTFYQAFKLYDRTGFRQFLKKWFTVFNPPVQLGNATSNYVFSFVSGIDPLTLSKHVPEAIQQVRYNGKEYLDLVQSGILGSDVVTNDLLPLDVKGKRRIKTVDETKKTLLQRAGSFSKALGMVDNAFTGLYQGSDNVAKLAAYLALRRDHGLSHNRAIKQVYDGYQNYGAIGKFYDFASKTPVFGNPYIKFGGDLARIMKNATLKKPLTTIGFLYLLRATADAWSRYSGESEEDKKSREQREFIPKLKLPFSLPHVGGEIPLTWQTPIGEVNVARFMSPYYIYDVGDTGITLDELTRFLPYQVKSEEDRFSGIENLKPSFSDVLLGPYAQVVFDRDFRGKSIRDPEANKFSNQGLTDQEMLLNQMNFIARSQIPFYKSASDMLNAWKGEADYYGRERNLNQAILDNFIKIQEYGPTQIKERAVKNIGYLVHRFESFNREIASVNRNIEREIQKVLERDISDSQKEAQLRGLYSKQAKRVSAKLQEQSQAVRDLEEAIKIFRFDPDLISEEHQEAIRAIEKRAKFQEENKLLEEVLQSIE